MYLHGHPRTAEDAYSAPLANPTKLILQVHELWSGILCCQEIFSIFFFLKQNGFLLWIYVADLYLPLQVACTIQKSKSHTDHTWREQNKWQWRYDQDFAEWRHAWEGKGAGRFSEKSLPSCRAGYVTPARRRRHQGEFSLRVHIEKIRHGRISPPLQTAALPDRDTERRPAATITGWGWR